MNCLRPLALGLAVLGALFCALAGCRRTDPPAPEAGGEPPWFVDITTGSGLDFRHEAGPVGRYFMPQIMGSGAALFDFDGDGLLDVYLVNNGGPGSGATNRLFRNLGGGRFQDVSAGSNLDIEGHGMGVAVGDVDNDGRPDVYVSQYGGGRLFRNLGGGKFQDVTATAGVAQPRWGTSAAFFDYDRDGWLDLVVVNYVDYDPSHPCGDAGGRPDYCHPNQFAGTAARLFHNRGRGPDGRWLGFEDVTAKSGLAALPGPGLGVVCADFDGDGWPDIFVANDAQANRLWINQKDGTFQDEAVLRGVAYNALGNAQANMGVALADVDGDGLPDLFVTHLTEETHTLWKQGPRGLFRDRTAALGLAAPRWRGTGFGTVLADFDHDGATDLAVVNGRVARGPVAPAPGLAPFWQRYAERNQLFANDGRGQFRDVSPGSPDFCGTPNVARGLAWGDVDGDGALDLLVTTVAGRARLYRNVAPKHGHWLLVRAFDPELTRDAYGAKVTVRAGGRSWVGLVNPAQSYVCSGDPRVHFGLGAAERVDGITVRWPDGLSEKFPGGAADRPLELRRGEGRKVRP
jgi:hypothetical protein